MAKKAVRSLETPDFISRQVDESDYFFLNLRPDASVGFTVTCGGLEYCAGDYHINRDSFDYYGLEYVVSGSSKLTLSGRTHSLKAGSLFCYGPQTPHEIRNAGEAPLVKFFVDFTGREVAEVVGRPFLDKTGPWQMPNLRDMHGLFRQMLQTGKQGGRGCQKILRKTLELIAAHASFKAINLEDAVSPSFATYERCLAHIQQQYTRIESVEQLAQVCHVSPGHLSRVFKKYCDETPWQMLTRLKMNRAGELLLNGTSIIKEVADQSGFPDPYHFSRVFKQYYGMSPKHFRESMGRPLA